MYFSVRDLKTHTSSMIRDAENGCVSIITKRGKPTALTLPFDRRLVDLGVGKALALVLFQNGLITLQKASRLADMPLDEFMDLLAEHDITAVDYPPEELDDEMKVEI